MRVRSRLLLLTLIVLLGLTLFGMWSISNAQGVTTSSRPDLSVSVTSTYWADYAAYTARLLSVDFSISNNSTAADAFDVAVTGSTNTGGVTLLNSIPVAVGNIASGGSAPVTLTYHVPVGVGSFTAEITATAKDGGLGNTYNYPQDPASTLVYSSNVKPATISVIDVTSKSLVNNFFFSDLAPGDTQGHFLSVSPDGKYLWVSEQMSATGGYVAVLDAVTGEKLKQWDVGAGVGNHMTHDGKWLFVASSKINGINVFDVQNQTYLGSFPLGAANHVMDSSLDSTTLWATDMALGNLRSFDITGLPGTLPTPKDTIHIGGTMTHALLVHPNGGYVFVGSSGTLGDPGTVIVDTATNSIVETQAGHMPGGPSLHPHNYEISPDQKYLVIGDINAYT